MRSKILVHAPNLSTPGGKQTYYAAIKDHFESDFTFFFYGAQGKKESKWGFLKRMIADYWSFFKQLKSGGYDLVLLNPSMNSNSFFRDCIFALLCRLRKINMVIFWHGWNWDFEKKTINKILPLFKSTFGKAESMVVLANEFKDRLLDYGYDGNIYLGSTTIDDSILEFQSKKTESEFFQKKENQIALLFLARVEENKGIYETIDSFHRLQSRYNNVVLNIAGVGGELEKAKDYANNKEIPNLRFTGWISGDRKANLLYESDIYILPTYHGEGMPNSILEAMACGLAVLTTDIGGIKDFFDPEKMGRFIEAKNTNDLTEKLDELISSPEYRFKCSQYNREYARKNYAPVQVANRLEKILISSESYN
jgi:glycosyltransferase involved in cell wall biosynthesis